MTTKQYVAVVAIVVVSTIVSFFSGFLVYKLLIPIQNTTKPNGPFPYFSDEIILISKKAPHYTLIAYVSRSTIDNKKYKHTQKAFFYDTHDWQRQLTEVSTTDKEIAKTSVIPEWKITDDPSYVLKQTVSGEAVTYNNHIKFEVPMIKNEMGIRSLAEYTIFRSESSGTLTVNGVNYDSYVLYTRTYSYSAAVNMITITKPIGINTDWVAFWDENGNFYNIDKTSVDENYEGEYKSHAIAILKDKDERVQKSFTFNVQKPKANGYKIDIFEKINRSLELNILNSVDKNTTSSPYHWVTGQVDGYVRLENGKTIKGFGIYEQLNQ